MEYYVGLDVSLKQTSICVVDQTGSVVRMRRKRAERKLVAALQRGELAVPRRRIVATATA